MERGIGTEKGEGFCRQPAENVCPDGGGGPSLTAQPSWEEKGIWQQGPGQQAFWWCHPPGAIIMAKEATHGGSRGQRRGDQQLGPQCGGKDPGEGGRPHPGRTHRSR